MRKYAISVSVVVLFHSCCVAFKESCLRPRADRPSGFDGFRVLVIGGTDGSGTRGVIDLLEKLGVPLVVDDHVSKDIHAQEIGGWPALVRPLLADQQRRRQEIRSRRKVERRTKDGDGDDDGGVLFSGPCSSREVEFPPRVGHAPAALAASTADALARLLHSVVAKSRAANLLPQSGGTSSLLLTSSNDGEDAWRPMVAFKAPMAMAVVPHLLSLGASVRFLHVVRDGRDVALSSNKSPVVKFFNHTFSGGEECWRQSLSVVTSGGDGRGDSSDSIAHSMRAARLWSVWNRGVFEWGGACAREAAAAAAAATATATTTPVEAADADGVKERSEPHPKFGYLTVRIEDLLLLPDSEKGKRGHRDHRRPQPRHGGDGSETCVAAEKSLSSSLCTARRAAAIEKIARFVGATPSSPSSKDGGGRAGWVAITPAELCCICAEPSPFLGASIDFDALFRKNAVDNDLQKGRHSIHDASKTSSSSTTPPPFLLSGYGKYRQRFADDPTLGSVVSNLTAQVNELLGYESTGDEMDGTPKEEEEEEEEEEGEDLSGEKAGNEGRKTQPICAGRRRNSSSSENMCDNGSGGGVDGEGGGSSEGSEGRTACARDLMQRVSSALVSTTTNIATATATKNAHDGGGCEFLSHFSVFDFGSRGMVAAASASGAAGGASSPQALVFAPDAEACCALCRRGVTAALQSGGEEGGGLLDCRHFAFDVGKKACVLLAGAPATFVRNSVVVSGWPVGVQNRGTPAAAAAD